MRAPFRMPSCTLEALKEAGTIKEQLGNQKPGKLKASIVSTLLSDACKALTSAKQTKAQAKKALKV